MEKEEHATTILYGHLPFKQTVISNLTLFLVRGVNITYSGTYASFYIFVIIDDVKKSAKKEAKESGNVKTDKGGSNKKVSSGKDSKKGKVAFFSNLKDYHFTPF